MKVFFINHTSAFPRNVRNDIPNLLQSPNRYQNDLASVHLLNQLQEKIAYAKTLINMHLLKYSDIELADY